MRAEPRETLHVHGLARHGAPDGRERK
jgi:hypothetical protein